MFRVTLRYMNCIVQRFDAYSVNVDARGLIYVCGHDGSFWTGWSLDGNTSIETEPAEENA